MGLNVMNCLGISFISMSSVVVYHHSHCTFMHLSFSASFQPTVGPRKEATI